MTVRLLDGEALLAGRRPPEEVARALREARERGFERILAPYDPALLALLAREPHGLRVDPLLPNAPQYVRELSDAGTAAVVLRRVRRLPPRALAGFAATALRSAPGAARLDFAAGLRILLTLEAGPFRRFAPERVFLHASLTDLLVAVGNSRALAAFADQARALGLRPGLATENFVHAADFLERHGLRVDAVVAPFNALGHRMRPSREACEERLERSGLAVLARSPDADGALDEARAAEYVARLPLAGVVLGPP